MFIVKQPCELETVVRCSGKEIVTSHSLCAGSILEVSECGSVTILNQRITLQAGPIRRKAITMTAEVQIGRVKESLSQRLQTGEIVKG